MSQQPRDETRDIFDVIATYFTNNYWFALYDHAADSYRERQFPTFDQAYKTIVERYKVAFCSRQNNQGRQNENYFKIIDDLRNNYNIWMHTALSQGDFINIVCKQIIPPDYLKLLARQDPRKDEVFRKTMEQAITNFTVFVVTEGLGDIENNVHNNPQKAPARQKAWKNELIAILYHERDEWYGRFMARKNGIDPAKKKSPITREAFDKMTEQIKKLIFEKAKLQKQLNQYVLWSKKEMSQYKTKIANLKTELVESGIRAPRRPRRKPLPRIEDVTDALESSSSTEQKSESEKSQPELPAINNPEADGEKKDDKDADVVAPLDAVPEYSGEEFVEVGDLGSDLSDSELSQDE